MVWIKEFLIVITCIMLFNCNKKRVEWNWNEIDKILIFEEPIKNYENMEADSIISNFQGKELNIEKAIPYFKKSKYYGKTYLWKGGSYYGLVFFKERKEEPLKIKLSAMYGVYTTLKDNQSYEIIGDTALRENRWKELYE